MPTWIIEPRDPLIVRDGRPFGPTPGARAATLPFPFPSTTTGGVRTQAGLDAGGRFIVSDDNIARVKGIAVRGPLLVEIDDADQITQWLVPAPADALLTHADDGSLLRQRLGPIDEPAAQTAWAASPVPADLHLLAPARHLDRKPAADPPRFWYWPELMHWLYEPPAEDSLVRIQPGEDNAGLWEKVDGAGARPHRPIGHNGPSTEMRMHVSIQPATSTALEGALFQTRGLEFVGPARQRLALAISSAGTVATGMAPLGGEGRLVQWSAGYPSQPPAVSSPPPAPAASADLPEGDLFATTCPAPIQQAIVRQRACRLVLLTPACFEAGYSPTWVMQQYGAVVSLKGAAVNRFPVVSGWDFAARQGAGAPKSTRRLAGAGSVFFFKLGDDDAAIVHWIQDVWMHCVSDSAGAQQDGFGLAVLGTWSGDLQTMEVSP